MSFSCKKGAFYRCFNRLDLPVSISEVNLLYTSVCCGAASHFNTAESNTENGLTPGCRTVSNNGSGSGLAPAQNILAVQVWFGFT